MRIVTLVAAIALAQSTAALARTEHEFIVQPTGTYDGTPGELRCEAGTYVVGVAGATGTAIDRIQVLCAPLGPDGAVLRQTNASEVRGGFGGGANSVKCRPGTQLKGIQTRLNSDDNLLEILVGDCGTDAYGVASGFLFGPSAFGMNFSSGRASALRTCPGQLLPTGLSIYFNKFVQAIGLICDIRIAGQAAAPLPVTAVPPPPARTGRVVGGRVADDPTSLWNGTWNAKDSQGEPFVITIRVKVDGYVIAKVAYAGDPQNAGSHQLVLGNGHLLPSANPPSLPWIKGSVSPPGDSRATFIMIKNGKRGSAVVSLLSQGQLIAGGGTLEGGEEYGFQATRGADTTPD